MKNSYILRNKEKIVSSFSQAFLERIVTSLDEAFKENTFNITEECKPFPILDVNDSGHSCGFILFHVIERTSCIYLLAYKETIN